ncbi:MAG TPA: DUF1329 domain-containing protein, partial [Nevskia sp.]|nr:DUF1329 domain-containing protein [Nevskia sp.]
MPRLLVVALSALIPSLAAAQGLPPLGPGLTPVGAEQGANKDGSIPPWSGGHPRSGKLSGEFPHDEQIDGDKPLLTITRANYTQYGERLTEGHKELFKRYTDYRMNVYPTRRTV